MTSSSPPVAERLREYLKIKYMTPSKITGDTYQMVPPEVIEQAASALIALQSERDAMEQARDRQLIERAIEKTKREAAEAQLAQMREALEPFLGDETMEDTLWGNLPDDANGTITFKLGELRRARASLSRKGE